MTKRDFNAEILRNIAETGCDLTVARTLDFEHLFPNRDLADAFAHQAIELGFRTEVEIYGEDTEDEPDDLSEWNVTASKVMIPTCEQITAVEHQLDIVAHEFGGHADGWGFLED